MLFSVENLFYLFSRSCALFLSPRRILDGCSLITLA